MNAIEINRLHRVYQIRQGWFRGRTQVVEGLRGISLNIPKGEIFGMLGPNGAGKTTLVKILSTLLIPTSGTAFVMGHEVVSEQQAVQRTIGVVLGGERGLYYRLSGRDNLRYFAHLYNLPVRKIASRIDSLLRIVRLQGKEDARVETYSRGMKQRLHIARALLHQPSVLLLDEPTIGLDPASARDLRQLVRELVAEGTTVLLTTHYMFEADELCKRIAVINHGQIVALDTPRNLKRQVCEFTVIELETFGVIEETLDQLRRLSCVKTVSLILNGQHQKLLVQSSEGAGALPSVLQVLNGVLVRQVIIREPTLEDAYLRLVAQPAS